jgi:hypothetical protein
VLILERGMPANAFCPQGQFIGLTIGENAEIDANCVGNVKPKTSAPCPPIEWPEIDILVLSILKLSVNVLKSIYLKIT